jgi:hypothetical protein
MRRQQPCLAHQRFFGLGAKGLLHDLAQGEVKHRHADEKDHYEGEEQFGEDPAGHSVIPPSY